jgi:diguanylate cyclase (GGDEF)-like protein
MNIFDRSVPELGNYTVMFFTIIIFLVSCGVCFLLFVSVRREFRKMHEEANVLVDGLLTKNALTSTIASHIARFGKEMPFPLLYVDLDAFGQFLEAFGEKESDKALEKIANNILSVLPTSARVSNYQGDKFLIFVNSAGSDRNQVLDMATRVKEAINRPIKIYDSDEVRPVGSIAVCFYPMHGENVRQLEDSLKIAMFNIKKSGGNAIRIYSQELTSDKENIDYYYQIKRAIHNKEFQLYYQAMVNTRTLELVGFETLVRWNHPEHGVLAPNKFLNIMEQSGDIDFIGLWGLEELIKTYNELRQEYPKLDLVLAMNLSPKQLINPNLPAEYQKILKKYKMEANRIAIEVAQFTIFDKKEGIGENIKKFRELGFLISVDGGELDYSIIAKPEAVAIKVIKFNSDFLADEDSYMKGHLLELIMDFSRRNECLIVCERIENESMVRKSQAFGIDIMQGWFFSKPVSTIELRDFVDLEKWKPKVQIEAVPLEEVITSKDKDPKSVTSESTPLQEADTNSSPVDNTTSKEEVKKEAVKKEKAKK